MGGLSYFIEKQYFRQSWLWVILLALNGLFVVGFVVQVILGKPFGGEPMPNYILVGMLLLTSAFTLFFFVLRLETEISKDGIKVRFFPFQIKQKVYTWSMIKESYTREYRPIKEYGGWGIKGSARNRAYNVKGKWGIQLLMMDGSRILIGTSKPAEADETLKSLGKLTGKGL